MKKILITVMMLLVATTPNLAFACLGDESGDTNADCSTAEEIATEEEGVLESPDARFQASDTLEVESDWKSSVFFAGNNVDDKSSVSGVGFIAGNILNIAGVYDYGLMAGNSLNISGEYKNDAFLAGNFINITKDAKIGRDLYIAGNKVTISTVINGNVYVTANEISFLDGAKINGDLAVSVNKIEIDGEMAVNGLFKHNDNVIVDGKLAFVAEEIYRVEDFDFVSWSIFGERQNNFTDRLITGLLSLASQIVVAVLFALLAKKFFVVLHEKTQKYDFVTGVADFGIGLLALVAVPMAVVFLILTLVGLLAGIFVLIAYIVLLGISSVVFAEWLGKKILKKDNVIINAIFGLVITTIIGMIPIIGGVVGFIVTALGFGMIFKVFFKKTS